MPDDEDSEEELYQSDSDDDDSISLLEQLEKDKAVVREKQKGLEPEIEEPEADSSFD